MASPDGSGAPQAKSFHFINTQPSSETERLQSRLLVRSHVGRWTWQQIKARSLGADSSDAPDSEGHGIKRSKSRRKADDDDMISGEANLLTSADISTFRPSGSPSLDNRLAGWPTEEVTRDINLSIQQIEHSGVLTSALSISEPSEPSAHNLPWVFDNPIDRTGAGSLDPFQTYPSTLPAELVNSCNGYSLSLLWPGLTPASPHGHGSAAASAWFPAALNDPTMFMACLFGSLSHKRVRWLNQGGMANIFGALEKRRLDWCEMESVRLINQAIRNGTGALSDAVIMSVLCMAANRYDESAWLKQVKSPFNPPLRSLQWLDVYGSLSPHPVHWNGLARLVSMRGGLENIQLPGLGATISFAGILFASRTLSHPTFPFIPLVETERPQTLQENLGFDVTEIENGFGALYESGFVFDVAEVFQAIKMYTSILEAYHTGWMLEPDMCLLSDQRNLIQHSLMSLPTVGELGPGFRERHPVYEASRLAGTIFGVGVVFPLPPQTAPFGTLVNLLSRELQQFPLQSTLDSESPIRLFLWILTLGGIAATDMPERTWFVAALARLTSHAGVSSWIDLKKVLKTMLWLDSACDHAGEQLWNELDGLGLSPRVGDGY